MLSGPWGTFVTHRVFSMISESLTVTSSPKIGIEKSNHIYCYFILNSSNLLLLHPEYNVQWWKDHFFCFILPRSPVRILICRNWPISYNTWFEPLSLFLGTCMYAFRELAILITGMDILHMNHRWVPLSYW